VSCRKLNIPPFTITSNYIDCKNREKKTKKNLFFHIDFSQKQYYSRLTFVILGVSKRKTGVSYTSQRVLQSSEKIQSKTQHRIGTKNPKPAKTSQKPTNLV
jgi:hypothetical protein